MNITEEQKTMISTAVQKMYEQGEPSVIDGGEQCVYSTTDGKHCIVGWMIEPTKYDPDTMEEQDVFDLMDSSGGNIFYAAVSHGDETLNIMRDLQFIHDDYVLTTMDMDEDDKPNFRYHWKSKVNNYSRREGYTDWLEVKD
jgi:hypothetical protein